MKRLFGLVMAGALLAGFAAADIARAELVTVYGPVVVAKHRGHHGEKETKLTFSVPTPGAGRLIIQNGADSGREARVGSAEVELNGKDVARERDFSKKVGTLQYDVTLNATNELEVKVESCRQCEISITVLGEPAVVVPPRPVADPAAAPILPRPL